MKGCGGLAACFMSALLSVGPVLAAQTWQRPDVGEGVFQDIAHKHWHKSGHALLGERLHQEGRHELEKLKGRSVVAEVRRGKVEKMDAEDLPMKRVKEHRRLASVDGEMLPAAYSSIQLAQNDPLYYGYCFDDGMEYNCYWYPASEVNVQDYSWEPYDPTY